MSQHRFVIDGTNVVLVHGRAQPELRYVLALCHYLKTRGDEFICYFDANTPYILEEHGNEQFEIFQRIIRDSPWSENLQVVPSGTEADEWILKRAKSDGAEVISNDKFRSRAQDNRWIWERRHSLRGTSLTLFVETLGMEIPVFPAAEDYL